MPGPSFVIDADSTLLAVESLDELAGIALREHPERSQILREIGRLTALGMNGEMSFAESLSRRLQLFAATRGHVEELAGVLREHISPSALEHQEWFQAHRERIHVVSGGFSNYIVPALVGRLGLAAEQMHMNRLTYDDSGNITGCDPASLSLQPQGKALQVAALGLPRPVIAIGDGFTDYEIRTTGAADQFWAFTETTVRPDVVAGADRVLSAFGNHLHLLALDAGIPRP